ncbi:heme exporter protein CcmD [Pseudaestuariivita atlantica]|nr:heme exporter protein CcmD [Pseudaestuariivita atlantica]
MNLDLGKYTAEVLLAYAGSLVLLVGIVWISVAQYRRAARDLSRAEKDAK